MSETTNTLFPGRPDYVGPTSGVFGFLHHEILFEASHNVMERVDYVRREKSKSEIAIRLHNMIYLGGCNAALLRAPLDADYKAKLAPLYADYDAKFAPLDADHEIKRAALNADYEAKRAPLYAEVMAYIKTHIPDCAWDGTQLVFA